MGSIRQVAAVLAVALGMAVLSAHPAGATEISSDLIRGVYGRDSSPTGLDVIADTGFNTVTAAPSRSVLDAIAAKGMKAIVWLGEYHRTARCEFEWSDETVRQAVSEVAGHPAIYAYQLSDEPTYARVEGCPAVEDHKARSELIKSIDPTKPTYVTVTTWDGREGYPYEYFVGAADILGLVTYPCSIEWDTWGGCQFDMIDKAIAEAEKDGVRRYIAVMQEFSDSWYRLPTSSELETQFEKWSTSRMEGYFLYHWNIADVENRPDHLAVLETANTTVSAASVAPEPTPTADDVTAPSTPADLVAERSKAGVRLKWSAATDDVGVVAYRVVRDGIALGKTESLSFLDSKAGRGSHVYEVSAVDAAANRSEPAVVRIESSRTRRTSKTLLVWNRWRF